jgi:hypothetical protein
MAWMYTSLTMSDHYDDYSDGPEPYENDLESLSDREAWEDAQADMREDFHPEGEDEECEDEPCNEAHWDGEEDSFLDAAYEERTEIFE